MLCALLFSSVYVDARVFEEGEVIYVKKSPANWSWYGNDDAGRFAYFYKEGTPLFAWSEKAQYVPYCGDVLQVRVPAGEWTHVIMTRNSVDSDPDWSNVHGNGNDDNVQKSADIEIPENQNYLDNFRKYKDAQNNPYDKWHWSDCYFYRPSEDPTSNGKINNVDKQVVEVCTQSSGDPLSLQPRLINETDGYDYGQARTWFKWDGEKWKELPYASTDWGFGGPGSLNETIGAANSHTYYFLSSKDQHRQRFIEISVTKDCSPTCEITDFGVVTSSVNVHDSTYVLEGVVAFGESLDKTLHISVTDAKGEHHVDYDPQSTNLTTPFLFSLPELYADGATLTATASFIGGGSECTRISDPYPAPNAIDGIKTSTINITHGETPTLTPSTPGTDGFKWHDGNTTDHERIVPAYCFDTTVIYTYYEYEPKPTFAGNLIDNGDFSADETYYGDIKRSNDVTGCDISDYNFWGKEVTTESNFYDKYMDGSSSLFGGFSIVTDANSFWKRYTKKIDAKAGTYYALFDADNNGSKRAWYANTGKSSKLKLVKGTNYMFSFWVANINNYGEMNNAAILQFAIRYKQDGAWSEEELLGNPIDLNEYKDNIWHQNSHVYTSPADADEVEIMVRDLNISKNPGGNDFALDDIQFQAISVHSQAIKNCERFVVNIQEPDITVNKPEMTILKTPACGNTDFEMQVHVSYSKLNNKCPDNTITLQLTDDIYGDIFTTPITIDPTVNPEDITLTLSSATYAMLVADGKEHKLTATITRKDCQGKEKSWQSSGIYTAPGVPALTVTEPVVSKPDCDQTTFDLEVKATYAYQSGTELLFYWDGDLHTEASKNISYGSSSTITTKLTGLTYDGNKHTLLIRTDNTTLDCQDSKDVDAPFSPYIYDYVATPKQMGCDIDEYDVVVTFYVTNGQGKEVTVWGKEDQNTTFAAKEGENTVTFKKVKTDAAKDYFNIWFVDAEANCEKKKTAKYDEPVTPHISVTQGPEGPEVDMDCNLTTYTVKFDISHTNQSGKLYGWIDDDDANKKEFDYEKNPATVTFTEVPGDGLEHTLHAAFDGENSCSVEIKSFKAPFTPVISDVQIKRSEMKCGETTFNVTVEATLSDNAIGHKLTVTGDTGKDEPITYDITDTKFSEMFTLDRDKATGEFVINFADANNCEPQTYTYFLPKVPALSVDQVKIPVPKCDQTTFDLTITGTYTYLRGTELHFLWDGVEKAKQTITSLSDVEIVSATLKDLAYDGQKHVLTVKSNESTYDICPFEKTDIEVPFSPDIKSTVAKVLPYVCDAPNYQVTITVTYEKTQGHDLIITDEAGHEKTLKATDAEYGETSASWTFDMPWENPVVEHTFKAYFEGAERCKDEDSHKDSYIAPKYWSSYTWEDDSSLEETFYICPDGSKYWNGETYSVAGDYEKKLQTVHGCDSIVMLHLLYWPTYTWETDSKLEETFYICPNGSKEWNGKIYTEEGDYELSLKTVHECDSIVMLHLRYYSIPSLEDRTTDDVVFKENLPYIWEGEEYTVSGNYEATKTTDDGCEYSVYLHLTVTDKPVENLDPEYMTICPGATIAAWRDLTNLTPMVDNYKFTTTITDEDKNYIATLIVNFYPIPSLIDRTKEDVVFTENLPYIWEGNEYTVSGNYEATKTTEDGCEYSVYLHLTVTDKPVENLEPDYMTICPGATIEAWHDLTDLTPTVENNVFTTTIHEADKDYKATLIVNFHPIPSMTERTTEVTVFTENLPYIWEGNEYTVSGNYEATKTTEDGCEYSVYLHLTVTDKPVENLDPEYMTICPGATIEAWRDLTNLTPTPENNIFTTTIHEADKDYVATLIVNFHSIPSLTDRTKDEVVFKENLPYIWEGEEYTESGSYQKTVTSADGCTYTIYLNLEVVDKPVENLEPDYMTICPGATIEAWHDLTDLTPTVENNVFTTTIHEADKDYKATLIVNFHPIPSMTERTTEVTVFTENLPYIWEGNEYTVSGNYEATKTTEDGCEYSVYLHLTVTDKPVENLEPDYMTICPGATIEAWHDLTDLTPTAENNIFTTTIHEADKDYKAKLIVDFYPIPSLVDRTTDVVVFTENLPYIWEGEEYTVSGNYEKTKTTDDGCEYSVYLHLTVTNKPVENLEPENMTICPGATIEAWRDLTDLTPTAENNVFTTTIHEADKDYKATLIVDFHPIPSITERTKVDAVFTENLPYIWEGNEYNESGNYEATKTTDDGCEYKIYLNLTVSDKIIEILDPDHMTICPGTTIDAWHDLTNLTPTAENNVFTTTIHDIDKDYFATLIVDFHPIPSMTERTTVDAVFTENLPYIWEGNEYNESGNYETTKTTDDGCEYKVYLHLTVTEKPVETLEPPDYMTICPGTTIDTWHDLTDLTPTPENNIFTTTIHEADKDYIAKLIVDFYPIPSLSDRTTDVVVFTEDLPYRWEGQDCMVSDTYEATKTTDDGCEYKIYLNLTVSDKPIEILDPPDYMTICPGAMIDTWHDLTNLTPTAENNVFTTTIHEADKDYKATLIVDFYPIPSLIDRTTDAVVFTEDLPYHWEGQDCMVSDTYEATKTTDDGCEYKIYLNLTVTDKPIEILDPDHITICPGTTIDAWHDLTDLTPTAENNVFTTTIHEADKDYKAKLIVDFYPVPTIAEATTNVTVFKDELPYEWNDEWFTTEQTGYTKELTTDDGCTYTATLNLTIASDPIVPEPEITPNAIIMPYACGDHTYSVNVQVEFANGQGHDLIVEDWKGSKQVFTTTPADTKIDDPPVFEYQKYTPGGKHGFKVYFDGYEDCAVYAYYIEPAQPKIDIVHTDIGSVTSCGATYDLSVTFDYYNQDGTLSVDLDRRPADNITPDFVKDEFDKQTATATFIGLTADGQKHTLTVQTTGGVHNCLKSVTVDAPEAEDIITFVEVTDVPENIRCDQTEYDVTVTVTMSSGNAIGKKIIIAHEGQTDDFIATANPMETTVRMTTADAAGLTVDAYFDGRPECKVTSKTFDAPQRLKCIKDYAQTCEGERYTWSVTGLTYGPFAKAGTDTIVNEFNMLDTLIVTVYPTYNMPEEQVTIIDGETYTWNGKDYETEGIYKETLLSEHDCDSIVTLNLTVKENIVEKVAFTIAEQCAGEGLLEIAVQHTGLLTDARLTFSPEAVAAGFVNDTYPLDDQDIVSVPYNVKAGIFSVHIDLLFHSRLKHSADEPFTLLFPRTVLEQGWMDAIFVLTHDYNGGYDFTDFQWYKKGQMLVGETGPYLYQPLEVGAEYSAMLTEVSGLKLMTCPLIVEDPNIDPNIYPTAVERNNIIHVNVSQDAILNIYTPTGNRFCSHSILSGDTQINAPGTQGIYLAEIILESGQRKVFKIMVR